jgi:aspartate dehydrogenase
MGVGADLSVAIIGAGSIGSYLARAIRDGHAGPTRLIAIADSNERSTSLRELASQCHCGWTTDALRLPDYKPSVVIEAAGPQAVREYLIPLLDHGISVFVMSAGALTDAVFLSHVRNALRRGPGRVHVPSGAIGGLDALRAASIGGGLKEVLLTTSKPPAGLMGAPWFMEHPIDWNEVTSPTVLFRGSVADAVKGFPNNVNVAAVLQLATHGVDSLTIEIIVDPGSNHNVHQIYARGTFGDMTLRIANAPSSANHKTSQLACLSPLALLRQLSAQLVVGS